MKLIIVLISIIGLFSCKEQIQFIKLDGSHYNLHKVELIEKGKIYSSSELESIANQGIQPLFLFDVDPEIQKSYYILYNESTSSIITYSKTNQKVIDTIIDTELRNIRNWSRDSILIEFIHDSENLADIKIKSYCIDKNGKIYFRSEYLDRETIFNRQTNNNAYTGVYSFTNDSIKLELSLKDGLTYNNYSHELRLFLPNRCSVTYNNLDLEIIEDKLIIDKSPDIILDLSKSEIVCLVDSLVCDYENEFILRLIKNG